MKKSILFILILSCIYGYTQKSDMAELESKKNQILNTISDLQDSIKYIEIEINKLRLGRIEKMIAESNVKGVVRHGAKLRYNPQPLSDIIAELKDGVEVVIMDYNNGYFGVCSDSICGYMSDVWLERNEIIKAFIKAKEEEERTLKQLEREQKLKQELAKSAELEKKYLKKYGQKTYNKLKQGYYWIGMNKEMAIISLGSPKDINRTVGSWGVHEQWVYDNLYLYFENGTLTSYQN
ncbi:coiled-coil domain-containing protein [Aestuariivivens sediminicola]|uniref:hypothetical protein n=1 Tax=Aestuariivivens sediminicola TaxID=2913560 RepID=UPI001F5907AC|nr:hypothetical protein [Aestuariivivens sediminicola]